MAVRGVIDLAAMITPCRRHTLKTHETTRRLPNRTRVWPVLILLTMFNVQDATPLYPYTPIHLSGQPPCATSCMCTIQYATEPICHLVQLPHCMQRAERHGVKGEDRRALNMPPTFVTVVSNGGIYFG